MLVIIKSEKVRMTGSSKNINIYVRKIYLRKYDFHNKLADCSQPFNICMKYLHFTFFFLFRMRKKTFP